MKLKYINICLLCAAMAGFSSCNDYLDQEPESAIIPEAFFTTDADLAAYTINLYNFFSCIQPGSYGISTFGNDNHTDNQAAMNYSSRWVPGEWKVPTSTDDNKRTDAWNFFQIRDCNYFFDNVLPKYKEGKITGTDALIRHYIGEMYVLRAYAYFDKLQTIGDCPIVETAMADDEAALVEASKRQPVTKWLASFMEDLEPCT